MAAIPGDETEFWVMSKTIAGTNRGILKVKSILLSASAMMTRRRLQNGYPTKQANLTAFYPQQNFATRAGTRGPWFWGSKNADACEYANVGDGLIRRNFSHAPVFHCEDGYEYSAPVGSYKANPWGLNDMLGNVWEWTEDCMHPTDGRAWLSEDGGECERRVPKGGSWVSGTDWVRAGAQSFDLAEYHSQLLGFRVGLTLTD